jgi:hypothetical protein
MKLTQNDISELAHYYLGYFDACGNRRQTLEKMNRNGWTACELIKVVRFVRKELVA